MKTSTTNNKIVGIAATLLMALMLSFSLLSSAAQTDPAKAPFDHTKTGFVLKDVHKTLKCEQCHVDGIFKNTPKDCAGCHATGTRVGAKPKPLNHVPTMPANAPCDTCHTSAANFLVRSFNHVGITGGCATCHNGQSLGMKSKPLTHFPTLLPCESCHTNTSTFLSWRMDHTGITTGCSSCHGGPGGSTYPGVVSFPVLHIAIGTADCNSCHTNFSTFLGAAYPHDATTTGKCGNCHEGQLAGTVSINPATHIPNGYGIACDTCHTPTNTSNFTSFKGAAYHLTTVGSGPSATFPVLCSSCHNGAYASQGAQGVNTGHVGLGSFDCATCHTDTNTVKYTSFLGATFNHVPSIYASFPADTAPGTPARCDTCHVTGAGGARTMPALHVPYTVGNPAQDCNGCHTNASTQCASAAGCASFLGAIWTHSGTYTTFPTAAPASPACTSCHGSGVGGAKMKPATHISTTQDCIVCHVASGTGCPNCTTFLGAVFSHQPGIYSAFPAAAPATPTCGSCHLTGVGGAKTYSASHIATSLDCIACHSNANTQCPSCVNFVTGGAAYNHSPSPYATFPTTSPASPLCSSCHNGSTATGTNAGHMLIGATDCSACHLSSPGCNLANAPCSSFLGAVGAAPHTVAFLGGKTCVSCHDGLQATGLSSDANHIPVAGIACDQCHPAYDGVSSINFGTTAVSVGMGGAVSKYAMNHTVLGAARCDSCHNGAYVGQGIFGAVAKVSNHIPTTITGSLDCTTCHTTLTGANIKIVSGSADWLAEVMNHNGAQGMGAGGVYCVTCHLKGVTYLQSKSQLTSHNGASTAKDCSSSSCHKPLGSRGTAYSSWGG